MNEKTLVVLAAGPGRHRARRSRRVRIEHQLRGRPTQVYPAGNDHARQASICTLAEQKEDLVVKGDFQVPLGIHLPAHRLCFDPDIAVSPALDESFLRWSKLDDIPQQACFRRIIQPLQIRTGGVKGDACW